MADLERGQRIRELREDRHLTQEAMADELGVTLRGYQEWEAGGGIKWENVKKLAKAHKVEADFVMNGPKGDTPDLLGVRPDEVVVGKLDEIIGRLDALEASLAFAVPALSEPTPAKAKQSRSTGKKRAAS